MSMDVHAPGIGAGRTLLADQAHAGDGPEDERGPADDAVSHQRPPDVRVPGLVAVVPEHKQLAVVDMPGAEFIVRVLARVRLIERLTVDQCLAGDDGDRLAGTPDGL